MLGKVLNVPIVRHHPLAILKRVAVEHRDIAVRGAPDVREHGLGGDDAADAMEENIIEGRCRASSDVWRPVDVERHAPAIAVVVALRAERVVSVHQRSVHLALNHAAEPE